MEIALQILFGIVSLICIGVGISLTRKGVQHLLPQGTPPQPKLDNTFRFLSGMFFSFGFLLIWVIFHIHDITDQIYFIGIVILCAGLGRLYSRIHIGSAGKYLDYVMLVEILLGMGTMLLQYLR